MSEVPNIAAVPSLTHECSTLDVDYVENFDDFEDDEASSSSSSLSLIYYNPQEINEYIANLPNLLPLIPDKDHDK